MAAPVLQLRVPEETLAGIDGERGEETRSAWLLRLIERELAGQGPAAGEAVTVHAPKSPPLAVTLDGDGNPTATGAPCGACKCWQRDTRLYGARQDVPLCTAHAHEVATGELYRRPVPDSAARVVAASQKGSQRARSGA